MEGQRLVYHKCKVRVANVANKQDHAEKDSGICQPLPAKNSANTLDGQVSIKDLWDRTHQAQIEIEILKRRDGMATH